MAFAAGEIVQLKSGSPALTIIAVDGDVVEVIWYAEEVSEFRTHTIPVSALDVLEIEELDLDEEDDEDEDEKDAH